MPADPSPCAWQFPPVELADETGLVGVGADLEPATLMAAYRQGMFPMPIFPGGPVGWWSPDPRGILELDELVVHRSLERSARRFEIRIDTDFAGVIDGCADPRRPSGWIDSQIRDAYIELHRQGWAHSIECWRGGRLVGGLYGVCVGGLFAGESMFHRDRDASKVALVATVEALSDGRPRLFDVQWLTGHLASLGVTEIPRSEYLRRLEAVLDEPHPPVLSRPGNTI